MRAFFALHNADLVAERPPGALDDVHFPEALVTALVEEYTSDGDLVLDPFAGYGTTLVVAERLGRRAVGVEILDSQLEIIRGRLTGTARVVAGDARALTTLVTDAVDLCVTSPPYMNAVNHPENPLNAYETLDGDYSVYLREIDAIFAQVASLLRPGGHLAINAANIVTGGTVTTLAWDIARVVSAHLVFRQESFLCWDHQPTWMSGDYCFVFQKPGGCPIQRNE
jgi:DNA modification methylase